MVSYQEQQPNCTRYLGCPSHRTVSPLQPPSKPSCVRIGSPFSRHISALTTPSQTLLLGRQISSSHWPQRGLHPILRRVPVSLSCYPVHYPIGVELGVASTGRSSVSLPLHLATRFRVADVHKRRIYKVLRLDGRPTAQTRPSPRRAPLRIWLVGGGK